MRSASRLAALLLPAALGLLPGCATVTGTATQSVSIHVVDANDRPVRMRCHVSNASADWYGDAPLRDLVVRRSGSDLTIECRQGSLVARGTAVSRGSMLEDAVKVLLPGGTAMMAIDHISGYRYAYPGWVELRVGQHLVFDADRQIAGRPAPGMLADTQ